MRPRFFDQHFLSVEDFFCILIWKANRSKTIYAKRLKEKSGSLADAVHALTSGLYVQGTRKDRLRLLIEGWGIWLPTASAILSVLYAEDFTVYDVRVCDALGDFHDANTTTKFDKIWERYEKFKKRVEDVAPQGLSLRDKDRYLWGKSFYEQLISNAAADFPKNSET